jgi:hypothetical protein
MPLSLSKVTKVLPFSKHYPAVWVYWIHWHCFGFALLRALLLLFGLATFCPDFGAYFKAAGTDPTRLKTKVLPLAPPFFTEACRLQ